MPHKHPVYDTDTHFIIDPITRAVENAQSKKNSLMQYDHNAEVFSFEIPRLVEGHDMMLCDRVEVHYINISSSSREKNPGVYEVRDMKLFDGDESTIVFTWLVSQNATLYAGPLNFLIIFSCTEDGSVTYRWSTNINNSITISSGMNNGDAIVEEYPDILVQWRNDLFTAIAEGKSDISAFISEGRTDVDNFISEGRTDVTSFISEGKTDISNHLAEWKQYIYEKNFAYEVAVENGFTGTEAEWLATLKGERGDVNITVGPTEPSSYPYFWFDTSYDNSVGLLTLSDTDAGPVYVTIDATQFTVEDTTINSEDIPENHYNIKTT